VDITEDYTKYLSSVKNVEELKNKSTEETTVQEIDPDSTIMAVEFYLNGNYDDDDDDNYEIEWEEISEPRYGFNGDIDWDSCNEYGQSRLSDI